MVRLMLHCFHAQVHYRYFLNILIVPNIYINNAAISENKINKLTCISELVTLIQTASFPYKNFDVS
jgi:hypothetical protein